ncbi:hypothetical protein EU408_22970 [Salmonella enterica subsp. enterica]|uniref:Uncharacterized protein n=1 Tax=Salmonella enterica subsp. enterica serovar Ouagadougou TaxID=2564899 RepID=A0A5I0D7W4_SALET|nr:hypothetical protein [Salmonella enterica subsp. enterica serovar Ouagadougou]ECI6612950.1 hypothetical protein [Salmonella enterica subsp. enterica]HBZ6168959.1 hypothetical protein [Salmonella enterica]EBR9514329.1 hypothetical protein [Salmonella enterica subsp. enterica serovar Ouagadougou]EBV0638035.1 hypothetical protein [Salmonella enterica subsp. enterica serovar Ouagadougou]
MLLSARKSVLRTIMLFIAIAIISVLVVSLVFITETRDKSAAHAERFEHTPDVFADYDSLNLTHRLVRMDEQNGIVNSNEARKAYGAINDFLRKVKDTCSIDGTTENFLTCANKTLGANFYYKPSATVAKAYANHYSDCDLNVYLMFDAARAFNKKVEIVYAPRHAFLSFTNEKIGMRFYWETTENKNTGATADITDSFYKKTHHRFYYSPVGEHIIEKLYPILSLADMDSHRWDAVVKSIDKSMSDNPIVLDFYYEYRESKKQLSQNDIRKLYGLIQDDISSVDKRLILARHFLGKGKRDEAMSILNQIDDSVCELPCMKVREKTSSIDRVVYSLMKMFKWFNSDISRAGIIFYVLAVIGAYAILLFFVISMKKNSRSKKKDNNLN